MMLSGKVRTPLELYPNSLSGFCHIKRSLSLKLEPRRVTISGLRIVNERSVRHDEGWKSESIRNWSLSSPERTGVEVRFTMVRITYLR